MLQKVILELLMATTLAVSAKNVEMLKIYCLKKVHRVKFYDSRKFSDCEAKKLVCLLAGSCKQVRTRKN